MYKAESLLRYMMGIAATDGRLIRPSDEPTTGKVEFDWYDVSAEALARNTELRQQKWRVKEAELELIAAKNYLLPRLDAVGQYRFLGLGDELIDPTNERRNAYGDMTSGKYQGWELGLELRIPIGFRKELAAVRNAQLNLARQRTILQEQELELSHQIAWVIRSLEENYTLSQTHFNRLTAAEKEVVAVNAAYETGAATLDLVLDAQERRARAAVDYYTALTNYMIDISHLHYRKGSLLEYNGIYLAEGPWPAKAYFDALRRARARDASLYIDYGLKTYPKVMSRGPYAQFAGSEAWGPGQEGEIEVLPDAEDTPILAPGAAQAPAGPVTEPEPADRGAPASPEQNPSGAAPSGMQTHAAARPLDLARLNLAGLVAPDNAGPNSVQSVSFQREEPPPSPGPPPDNGSPSTDSGHWERSRRLTTSYEPRANLPPVEADPSAASWKRVQHRGAGAGL